MLIFKENSGLKAKKAPKRAKNRKNGRKRRDQNPIRFANAPLKRVGSTPPVSGRPVTLLTKTESGRNGGIRTHDPSPPRRVRYQTALRSDTEHSNGETLNRKFEGVIKYI